MQICINKARHRKTSNRCRNAYVDAALPQCVPQRLRSTCLCAGSTRRASHISSAFYRMVFSFRLFLLFSAFSISDCKRLWYVLITPLFDLITCIPSSPYATYHLRPRIPGEHGVYSQSWENSSQIKDFSKSIIEILEKINRNSILPSIQLEKIHL